MVSMKQKKILFIIEILVVLVIGIVYYILKVVPELKQSYGSSDAFLSTSRYKGMVEFQIDGAVDFAVLLDKEDHIYHLFFFQPSTSCLYNQNIEKSSSLSDGFDTILSLLIQYNLVKNDSFMSLIQYGDVSNTFFDEWQKMLKKYEISSNSKLEKSSLDILAKRFEFDNLKNDESILQELDFYSKDKVILNRKVSLLNDENALKFSNHVYQKLEKYIVNQKIHELDKNQDEILLSSIAGDEAGVYYPSNRSWFYVKDDKVFAYIEFVQNQSSYGYCYEGSIDFKRKGEC